MATSTFNPEKLRWDPERLKFIYGNGKEVKAEDVRRFIDRMVEITGGRLTALGEALLRGDLRVTRWQTLAAKEIKMVHVASFTIGKGGQSQMKPKDEKSLAKILKFQLGKLKDFATGMPSKNERDGRVPSRLEMYGRAAVGTYENSVLDRNKDYGLSIARRVTARGSASCDPCIDEEDIGWQDINEIARIGETPCGARCNCGIEYEEII